MFHVVSPGHQPCASRESGARSFQRPVNLQDGQIEQAALVLLRVQMLEAMGCHCQMIILFGTGFPRDPIPARS